MEEKIQELAAEVSARVSAEIREAYGPSLADEFSGIMMESGIGLAMCESPASSSTSRHHCFKGGLLVHSAEVAVMSLAATNAAEAARTGNPASPRARADAMVAAILHDANKTVDVASHTRRLYVANVLKSGKVSDLKPWKRNKEFLSPAQEEIDLHPEDSMERVALEYFGRWASKIPEGWISTKVVDSVAPGFLDSMSPDVRQAIELHAGGYCRTTSMEASGSESELAIAVHYADMMSSRGKFVLAEPWHGSFAAGVR